MVHVQFLIEVIIAGLPVIINDLSTLMEIINIGKYVMVFKSKISGNLEKKIMELVENNSERNKLENAVKGWALSQYIIEKYISN